MGAGGCLWNCSEVKCVRLSGLVIHRCPGHPHLPPRWWPDGHRSRGIISYRRRPAGAVISKIREAGSVLSNMASGGFQVCIFGHRSGQFLLASGRRKRVCDGHNLLWVSLLSFLKKKSLAKCQIIQHCGPLTQELSQWEVKSDMTKRLKVS